MDKVISIVNDYSHPDMIIKARYFDKGIVINAQRSGTSEDYHITPEDISLLSSKQVSVYVDNCIKSLVAEASVKLLNFKGTYDDD